MKTKPMLLARALSGILFISVCALLPSPAQAECKRWDVSGQWELRMDDGTDLQLNLQQQGANFTGTGTITGKKYTNSLGGAVSGNITDNAFTMELTIPGQTVRYLGTVRPSGMMHGTSWNQDNPGNKFQWIASIKCADAKPTPSAEADKSSSSDTEDQPKKHKKKHKKKLQHRDDGNQHDDEENQGND